MTVTTPSGKEFNCDKATQTVEPRRLYLHLIDTSIVEIAMTVLGENGLPLKEFPNYYIVQSISASPFGVNLVLS